MRGFSCFLGVTGDDVRVDESRWVWFEGGPEDGEYRPVSADAGRLPSRVEVPEYLPAGTVPGSGPILTRVHVYELLDALVGDHRPVYRWMDPEG